MGTKRQSLWRMPTGLKHIEPLARRLRRRYGTDEIEAFIQSLSARELAEYAEMHADFRRRRLIHVFSKWYESIPIPDLERTGARAVLRSLIVFDLLAQRGVRPFNRYKRPLVWKTARPRAASIKLPLPFQYLLPALRAHAVIGTEQQLIETVNEIQGPERARLIALKSRAFNDKELREWLSTTPAKQFRRAHELTNSFMLMLDHL